MAGLHDGPLIEFSGVIPVAIRSFESLEHGVIGRIPGASDADGANPETSAPGDEILFGVVEAAGYIALGESPVVGMGNDGRILMQQVLRRSRFFGKQPHRWLREKGTGKKCKAPCYRRFTNWFHCEECPVAMGGWAPIQIEIVSRMQVNSRRDRTGGRDDARLKEDKSIVETGSGSRLRSGSFLHQRFDSYLHIWLDIRGREGVI